MFSSRSRWRNPFAAAAGRVACVAALCVLFVAEANGQAVTYGIACPTCRVELRKIATLGGPSAPVSFSRSSSLDVDSRGRFYGFSDESQVVVFGPDGKFLAAFGKRGEGPGEFPAGAVRRVVIGPGDSVYVFHPPSISVFSAQYSYVRTIRTEPVLATVGRAFVLNDGSFVVGARSRSPELIGSATHLLSPVGRVIRSLGGIDTVAPGAAPPALGMSGLSPDQESVWEVRNYTFEQWRIRDNAKLASFEITGIPDVPPVTVQALRGRSGIAQLSAGGLNAVLTGVDTAGMIWMLRTTTARAPAASRSTTPAVSQRLELIDPRTRKVYSSQPIDEAVYLAANGRLAITGRADADGILIATVWTYAVVRNEE